METKLPTENFGFSEYSQIFESSSSSAVPQVRTYVQTENRKRNYFEIWWLGLSVCLSVYHLDAVHIGLFDY